MKERLVPHSALPIMPALISAKLAVYKKLHVPNTKQATRHWTGFLVDEVSLAVLWCDGTVTHYGPGAADDGLDPASYTADCLRQDMAAAARIVLTIKQLAAKDAVGRAPRKSSAAGPAMGAITAITAVQKCYASAVPKPDWLVWLEGHLQEAAARERSLKRCRKCNVDGCNVKAPPPPAIIALASAPSSPPSSTGVPKCRGFSLLRARNMGVSQKELSSFFKTKKKALLPLSGGRRRKTKQTKPGP